MNWSALALVVAFVISLLCGRWYAHLIHERWVLEQIDAGKLPLSIQEDFMVMPKDLVKDLLAYVERYGGADLECYTEAATLLDRGKDQ